MKKLISILMLAPVAYVAQAQTLYGLSSDFFSNTDPAMLWSVDESTGSATFLTDVTQSGGAIVQSSIVGMASMNGVLYASDIFNSSGTFGSIDPNTGIYTAIGNQNGSANWWQLAADPSTGTLYTVESDAGQSTVGHLLSVSTVDGSTTDLGQIVDGNGNNLGINEIAFDTANSTLYGLSGSTLYAINTSTDVGTLIGGTGIDGTNVADLTFDSSSNTLFENIGGDSVQSLYSINASTGVATLIGANGGSEVIDGLAPVAAPEPCPIALLALGVVAMARGLRSNR